MTTHKLEAEEGNLYITLGGEKKMVMFFCGGDDIRVPSWPDCDFGELYTVLYAMYQSEDGFKKGDIVQLPDGRYFGYAEGLHFVAYNDFGPDINASPSRNYADY